MNILSEMTVFANQDLKHSIQAIALLGLILIVFGLVVYCEDSMSKRAVPAALLAVVGAIMIVFVVVLYNTAEKIPQYEARVTDYAIVQDNGYKIIKHLKDDVYFVQKTPSSTKP